MKKIIVINGPNLNMLGVREPEIYGTATYADLVRFIKKQAKSLGVSVKIMQFNDEGKIVSAIQKAYRRADGIVINAGGYSHTSIAIMDALLSVGIPTVEVHLSDVAKREEYRRHSFVSEVAKKVIVGRGFDGYREALQYFSGK